MKQVLPRIWQWSWFSPEKQLEFNGHLLAVGEHRILIDPPPGSGDNEVLNNDLCTLLNIELSDTA